MLFFSTAVLANEGYIIIASNLRANDEYGGNDINDVLNLIHVAEQVENADTSKNGAFLGFIDGCQLKMKECLG